MMSFLTLFDSKTDTSLVFTLYGCFAHAGVLSWDRQAQWCILIVCLSNKPHPSFIVTASDLSPASINNLLEQYTSESTILLCRLRYGEIMGMSQPAL